MQVSGLPSLKRGQDEILVEVQCGTDWSGLSYYLMNNYHPLCTARHDTISHHIPGQSPLESTMNHAMNSFLQSK